MTNKTWILDIKIGYLDVPVYETLIDDGDLGEFCSGVNPFILIDQRLKKWTKVQTLLHEIFHAAAWVGSHDNKKLKEETWVDFAACSVVTIVRDNSQLLEWISQQVGLKREPDLSSHNPVGIIPGL